MRRIEPFFPLSHGVPPRVADGRVVSVILFVIRNGLGWRDAPLPPALTRPSATGSSDGASRSTAPTSR